MTQPARNDVRDRIQDHRLGLGLGEKPPVLQRATIRLVCVAALLVIVYGTLGPLGYGRGRWIVEPDGWSWLPPVGPTDYNDAFTNLLVYFPVGVALRLLLRRRGSAAATEISGALLVAVGLSYLTELFQQYMPARTASRFDIAFNTIGAASGVLLAPRVQDALRRLHAAAFLRARTQPWSLLASLAAAVTALMMAIPFDFSLTPIAVDLYRPLELLDVRRGGMFLVIGFAFAMSIIERGGRRSDVVLEAFRRLFVLGIGLELLQLLLVSHECDLVDMVTVLTGGLAGAYAARWCADHWSRERDLPAAAADAPRVLPLVPMGRTGRVTALCLLFVAIGLYLASASLWSAPDGLNPYGTNVLWLPFQMHFLKTPDLVAAEIFESLVLFGGLTAICLYLARRRGRRLSLLLLCSLVALVQTSKLLTPGGVADVTPALLALVAWGVTVRIWKALQPRPRHTTATQSVDVTSEGALAPAYNTAR